MDEHIIEVLAWQAFAMLLIWVPFALTAFVVEHWSHPTARRWRATLVHPLRAREQRPLAFGH
ncbi:MAG: hypothetical protein Q8O67_32735 [Deltaproteobacteria bacterium]|nr:hypothetical protein [Deltaproteobacteria bacterium]